jgi:hypothetical protein
MLEECILVKLQKIGLEDANCVLNRDYGDKKFNDYLELHSILLEGGGAKCYYDQNDNIKDHKDLDIHIFFSPKKGVNSKYIKKLAMKIGCYRRPKVIKNKGFPTKEDRVDIMRNVLHNPKSEDIILDILKYTCPKREEKKWKNFLENPKVLLYPEIKSISFKLMNKCINHKI